MNISHFHVTYSAYSWITKLQAIKPPKSYHKKRKEKKKENRKMEIPLGTQHG